MPSVTGKSRNCDNHVTVEGEKSAHCQTALAGIQTLPTVENMGRVEFRETPYSETESRPASVSAPIFPMALPKPNWALLNSATGVKEVKPSPIRTFSA